VVARLLADDTTHVALDVSLVRVALCLDTATDMVARLLADDHVHVAL
jgi:hypothetical protein